MMKLFFAALVLGLAACGDPAGSRQAPEFALQDLAGKTVSLASFRGKPVLVNFWATWCDTCQKEMPDLEELSRLSGGRFSVIGVSMDENQSAVPPFIKEHKVTFPILYSDGKVSAAYAVRGLPAAFLIDAEGRIARRWVGVVDVRSVEREILGLIDRRP